MSYAERRKGKLTGTWIAERVINGRVTRFRADSKKAGDAWETYVDRFGTAPMDGTGASVPDSIGALAKRARAERTDWKQSRDPSLDQRIEGVVAFFGSASSVDTITNGKLLSFVKHLEGRPGRFGGSLSGKTINRYLAVVSGLLDHARLIGWTTNTPAIPWQNETKGRILYFKDEQDQDVLRALEKRPLQICYEVLARAALRPSEFFTLEPSQIDVRNDWAWLRLWKTKTDEARSVPVPVELGSALRALIEAGERPTHREFYRALKTACRNLQLEKRLTVYSLRHTGLTRAARKNAGAKVQKFAGHSDYRTTQNYVHLEDEDMASVASSMV